jgi:trans-aconitate methyltransferase
LHRRRQDLVDRELAGTQVVEVGCGPGALLAALAARHPEASFLGLDVDAAMIEHARERHAAENVRFDVVDLGTARPPVVADFAYSVDVLHHVHEPLPFLRNLRELLRPGGTWLALEPNVFHPFIYWSQERMRRAGFDEDHFRPWAMEPLFRETGFDVAERRYAFLFPGWVERVPRAAGWLEPLLERFRLLGAGVVYRLVRS